MRILIASQEKDHLLRFEATLKAAGYMVHCAHKATQMESELLHHDFDIVFVDWRFLEPEGPKRLMRYCQEQPETQFLLLSDQFKKADEVSAILFGAKGCITYDIPNLLFGKVARCVMKGEIWVDRKFISALLSEVSEIVQANLSEFDTHEFDRKLQQLTPRELEIAKLISTGASNPRIAQLLCITERTVKAHLSEIFRKLEVADRLQLALFINRSFRVLRKLDDQ